MTGSKVNDLSRAQVLDAVQRLDAADDYVWDGVDEDERPLSEADLKASVEAAVARRRGRPAGSGTKVQVAIRIEREVIDAFRQDGPGWQTRMNDALKDWLGSRRA